VVPSRAGSLPQKILALGLVGEPLYFLGGMQCRHR
jgi:hypothetical protein